MNKKTYFEEVPIDKLRWRCRPESLPFKTTEECEYKEGIIGQDRAVKALRLGLGIKSPGYNIYVSGRTGTGRTSTIMRILNKLELGEKIPNDICYVNNFKNPDMPKVIFFSAGMGQKFAHDMDDLVGHLIKQIPLIFESEQFKKVSEEIIESYRSRQKEMVKNFSDRILSDGFQLVAFQIGPFTRQDVAPLYEGKPVPIEQLEALMEQDKFSKDDLERIKNKLMDYRIELDSLMRESREIEKEIRRDIDKLEYESGRPVVSESISDIRFKYSDDDKKINEYLDEVQENILSNLKTFKEKEEETQQQQPFPVPYAAPQQQRFTEYKVNVLVNNEQTARVPIILETDPTYKNLFGTIEREIDRAGFWKTDFTKIKAGSLLRANGGYLVFMALDALIEPGVWYTLKRALKNRSVNMQPFDPYGIMPSALKPEPIPLDVKVVMIGDDYIYRLLYVYEEDFKKIFKTKSDFDTEMANKDEHIDDYVCFIKRIIDDEKLLQFDRTAVAAVIEYGVRLTGRQKKLSTRFSEITDLIRESHYWATQEGSKVVAENHVEKAVEEKIERVKLIEDKIQEMIEDGTIMIDTEGAVIGQINGLAVYDMGDHAFGKPSRITAKTSMGRAGVINIEREAKLSGKTHDKGVLILEGYFRGKYAQDKPLTMSASLCFEQSYSGVDGDSASSTEIYALISSLTELPIRQDLAVTGSVNQKGEVQPIGGVNYKVEGFFDVCKAKGLTGTQGVLIPALNIPELMLRKDVVEAARQGKFHIYPVKTIDEGIAILTGVETGVEDDDGNYPEGSVNYLVNEKLKSIAKNLKQFGEEEKKPQSLDTSDNP